MSDRATVVEVEHLQWAYPEQPVFSGGSARIGCGATLLQGEESSGKTTLLRLLAGELQPQGGCVRRGACQGVAAALFWVDPRATGLEDCVVRAWLQGTALSYPTWDAQALQAHLDGFALSAHLDKTFHMLSAGTRRKVLMAAALASGARLTLIDEPVAGLDRASVRYLEQAICGWLQTPDRALVVAHYETLPGVPWSAVLALPWPAPQ